MKNSYLSINGKSTKFISTVFIHLLKTFRFAEFAINGNLSHAAFKESLGIFGIDSLSFLSDRMYSIMDSHNTGKV